MVVCFSAVAIPVSFVGAQARSHSTSYPEVAGTSISGIAVDSSPTEAPPTGQAIANGAVVYMLCYSSGTPVGPSKDPYWYKIASGANAGLWVSADNFWNTGGSARGSWSTSPLLDSSVPNCASVTSPPVTTIPAPAPTPIPSGNVGYRLVNGQSGLCLDSDTATEHTNGGKVQVWSCNGGTDSSWHWVGSELVNEASGLCLDAASETVNQNGGKVQVWQCYNSANQQWYVSGNKLVNRSSGKCLDAASATVSQNGGAVQVWQCFSANTNQNWAFRSVAPPTTTTTTPPPSVASEIVSYATQEIGLPYCWDGGTTSGPSHGTGNYEGSQLVTTDCSTSSIVGFDCTGLVQYVVSKATGGNVVTPHSSALQNFSSSRATSISTNQSSWQPGDVLVFANGTHAGIYIGGGYMIDANIQYGSRPNGVLKWSVSWETSGMAVTRVWRIS